MEFFAFQAVHTVTYNHSVSPITYVFNETHNTAKIG